MGWQLSHAVLGRRRSLPHSFWPIWNGGARTSILCVLTNHYKWGSCSHESEVADCSRNAIGTVLLRWQREERTDDGRQARCALTHCRRFPLEWHQSQMWVQDHVTGRLLNMPATE